MYFHAFSILISFRTYSILAQFFSKRTYGTVTGNKLRDKNQKELHQLNIDFLSILCRKKNLLKCKRVI